MRLAAGRFLSDGGRRHRPAARRAAASADRPGGVRDGLWLRSRTAGREARPHEAGARRRVSGQPRDPRARVGPRGDAQLEGPGPLRHHRRHADAGRRGDRPRAGLERAERAIVRDRLPAGLLAGSRSERRRVAGAAQDRPRALHAGGHHHGPGGGDAQAPARPAAGRRRPGRSADRRRRPPLHRRGRRDLRRQAAPRRARVSQPAAGTSARRASPAGPPVRRSGRGW